MGLLSGRLGLKKLAFLQERDDWLSATPAKRVPVPHANTGGHCFLSIFNYSLTEITFSDEHVRDTLRSRTYFELLDSNRMVLQLVFVTAELLRADYIFLAMLLNFSQDCIQLVYDRI
jgi:hypothetical protein